MAQVYLTVRTDTKRIPGQTIHYATVHDLNDRLLVSATLDYINGVAQERGYVFIGENPAEVARQEAAALARAERLFRGPVESVGPLLTELEDAGRDFDREADAAEYMRSIEA